MHKKIIRKAVIKKRNLINQNAWKLHSSIVCKRIIHKINLLNKKIGIYFPINNEVSILELCNFAKCKKYFPKIKNNKINFCEYFSEKKIHYLELLKKPKQFNLIFENKTFNPKIAKNILIPEIIFIPLVAFNEKCFRVGYGGGFYDKYLANKSIIKIGVAFEFQKIEFTPEKHDIQLNYIFTEKKVYHSN